MAWQKPLSCYGLANGALRVDGVYAPIWGKRRSARERKKERERKREKERKRERKREKEREDRSKKEKALRL